MLTMFLVALATAQPDAAERDAAERTWRALTYNVCYEQTDHSKALEAIAQAEADLVCIQEVTPGFVTHFGKRFGHEYPHRHFEPRTGTWGVGIASKDPLLDVAVFEQAPHKMPAMKAVVRRGDEALVAVCVHWFPPIAKRRKDAGFFESMSENATLREQQARQLIRRFKDEQRPVLLLGDFNEDDEDAAVQHLVQAGFAIACDAPDAECGATYPAATSVWPAVFQVDHILGRKVRFSSATTFRAGSSDHWPLMAEFSFERSTSSATTGR